MRPLSIVLAFALSAPSLLIAQLAEPQRPLDGGTREILVSILIPSIPNAPFSAIVNTEWIRPLSDGSSVTLRNHRAIARDRAGRIFQERRLLVPEDGRHESVVTKIEISYPVSHKLYICVPSERVCQLEFFNAPAFAAPAGSNKSGSNASTNSSSREDLGPQTIFGLETEGTLEEQLIAPGVIGNDQPLKLISEYWYSPQLVLRPRDYVTKLVSGLLTCKLPLDGGPVAVHAASPGPSLLVQASDVSDSAFS